jgi:hypothetical protein
MIVATLGVEWQAATESGEGTKVANERPRRSKRDQLLKEKENMRSKWTYDLDAVELAASVIEREFMTALGRLSIPRPLRDEPVPTETDAPEELNYGERLYAAFKALERLKGDFYEMLTTWELSPARQAEFPTENVVLEGYPDQASIDLRLAHGFALVWLKTGELAWFREEALEADQDLPFFNDDLDGAVVLLSLQRPHVT